MFCPPILIVCSVTADSSLGAGDGGWVGFSSFSCFSCAYIPGGAKCKKRNATSTLVLRRFATAQTPLIEALNRGKMVVIILQWTGLVRLHVCRIATLGGSPVDQHSAGRLGRHSCLGTLRASARFRFLCIEPHRLSLCGAR